MDISKSQPPSSWPYPIRTVLIDTARRERTAETIAQKGASHLADSAKPMAKITAHFGNDSVVKSAATMVPTSLKTRAARPCWLRCWALV